MKTETTIKQKLQSKVFAPDRTSGLTPLLEEHLDNVAGGVCGPHSSKGNHESRCHTSNGSTTHNSVTIGGRAIAVEEIMSD
jgi:hypothetical protein